MRTNSRLDGADDFDGLVAHLRSLLCNFVRRTGGFAKQELGAAPCIALCKGSERETRQGIDVSGGAKLSQVSEAVIMRLSDRL